MVLVSEAFSRVNYAAEGAGKITDDQKEIYGHLNIVGLVGSIE